MPDGSVQVQRPEFVAETQSKLFGVVEKPLTAWERKSALLLVLAAAWEIYARKVDNPLVFPTFTATVQAFFSAIASGVIPQRTWASIRVLLQGYCVGLVLAALLTALATASRVGTDLLETLTAMFNPLPSIALLPLAVLWFGLGNGSLIFVLIHAVLWSVALNTHAGFRSVSQTLRMVGRNYGLSGPRYVTQILIPAAFPNILTGLKIGWAFAWRTLIAAELVFGVSQGSGGLGWYDVMGLVRTLAKKRRVVGMDLTEYSYVEGQNASAFLCAKLIYKSLAFIFQKETARVRKK